jgi:peptidoglycan/xylan/chitin deacetylase (PgdA/CDA1 family)
MNRATVLGGASAIVLLSAISYGVVRAGWLSSAPPATPDIAKRASGVSALPPSSFDAATLTAPMTVGSIPARASSAGSAPNTGLPLASASPPGLVPRVSAPKPITCTHPGAMGVSRVVEIDTSGGPGFGFQHFKSYDFLQDHEVVLTFDDGPWLGHTPAVLKALADQCLRATFFIIGKHSTYYPEILKQVVAAGHTVGTHTWSHADLAATVKKGGADAGKDEIEKGFSAVRMMAGGQIAPFFRFPDLRHPPEMVTYLGERNVGIFSTDIDSWDYKIKKPEELIKTLTAKIQKAGKGIILMHDFQKVTSIALPQILAELQKGGFKVVHMVPKEMISTLPQYDEAVLKENKLQTVTSKPAESVVRTVAD